MAEKPQKPKQLLLDLEQHKAAAAKKSVVQRKKSGNSTSKTSRSTRERSSTSTTRTKTVRSAEQPNPHLVQSHAKRVPPKRVSVQPPPLGKRKGYRPAFSSYFVIPLAFSAMIVLVLSILWVSRQMNTIYTPQQPSKSVIAVSIERGMTARSVSLLLEQLGVIEDSQELLSYFVEHDIATVIRIGSYLMESSMGFEEIGRLLTAAPENISLTIQPAFTLKAIDRYLSNRLGLEEGTFLEACEDLTIAYGLGFAEGWLLSGTYEVNRQRAAEDLVLQMYNAMLVEVSNLLDSELLMNYSVEDLLIIASMIQAETQQVREMDRISSVIHNRLRNNEPLGIDATTRYELDDWVNPIPTAALETKSPYNTRRKEGLPPSGICSPSKEAVRSAFFPATTPYYYYLHGFDREIYFAETYEQHKENITLYRKQDG